MDLTTAFVARMAPVLSSLAKGGDLPPEHLAALDACHHAEIDCIDRIVHGMVCSFRCTEIFRQYWRGWIHASLVQYLSQLSTDPAKVPGLLAHYGASLPTWNRQLESMYHAVTDDNVTDPDDLAQYLKATMDAVPELSASAESNWEIGSPDACCPFIRSDKSVVWFEELASTEPILAAQTRPELLAKSIQRFQAAEVEFGHRYQASKAAGTAFYWGVEFIRSQQF